VSLLVADIFTESIFGLGHDFTAVWTESIIHTHRKLAFPSPATVGEQRERKSSRGRSWSDIMSTCNEPAQIRYIWPIPCH
jgi:hypothetical protein